MIRAQRARFARAIAVAVLLALGARAEPPRFVRAWGGLGAEPGQFNLPVGIALTVTGDVYVTDHYNDRVQHFDADGKLLGCHAVLPNPGGIAIDPAGRLYVTHFPATKPGMEKPGATVGVAVYAADATLLRQWGKKGAGDGEFDCPGGVALGADGRVFVADQTNHRVQVFDAEGKFLQKWGAYGSETGQFGGGDAAYSRTGGPQFIALDSGGNVWTSESMGCRIQKFSPRGEFLLSWGDKDDRPGGLGGFFSWPDWSKGRLQGPIGLCFDTQGQLWISAVSGRVQCFTPGGKFIRGMGDKQGSAPGEFNVPHGIAVGRDGRLYVVDSLNHRVQQFQM